MTYHRDVGDPGPAGICSGLHAVTTCGSAGHHGVGRSGGPGIGFSVQSHSGRSRIKAAALFLTAAVMFRFKERRTMAEFAPYDWVAAVAVGAVVGRTATAPDGSWPSGAVALSAVLATHALVSRLRHWLAFRRFIDPPVLVLVRDGGVDRRNLRRCGMTDADLDAALHQHGYTSAAQVHLAISDARGVVSILTSRPRER